MDIELADLTLADALSDAIEKEYPRRIFKGRYKRKRFYLKAFVKGWHDCGVAVDFDDSPFKQKAATFRWQAGWMARADYEDAVADKNIKQAQETE